MKILKQKDYILLNRKNINLEVEYPKSKVPSKEEIKKQVASFLNADENLIVIKHIYPRFGISKADIIANVYNDINALKQIEESKSKKAKKEKKPKEDKRQKEVKDAKKEEKK